MADGIDLKHLKRMRELAEVHIKKGDSASLNSVMGYSGGINLAIAEGQATDIERKIACIANTYAKAASDKDPVEFQVAEAAYQELLNNMNQSCVPLSGDPDDVDPKTGLPFNPGANFEYDRKP